MSAAERLTASCSAVVLHLAQPLDGAGSWARARTGRLPPTALVLGDRHVGALEPDPLGAGGQVGKVLAGGAHDVLRSTWRTSMYASSGAARSV